MTNRTSQPISLKSNSIQDSNPLGLSSAQSCSIESNKRQQFLDRIHSILYSIGNTGYPEKIETSDIYLSPKIVEDGIRKTTDMKVIDKLSDSAIVPHSFSLNHTESTQATIDVTFVENISHDSMQPGLSVVQIEQHQEIPIILSEANPTNIESKLFLTHVVIFCVSLSLLTLSIRMMPQGTISYRTFMICLYSCLGYIIIENLIRVKCFQREPWRKREDILSIVDSISVIMFLAYIRLNIPNQTYPLKLAAIPLIIDGLLYNVFSKASKTIKISGIVMRCFYVAQGLLIIIKLQEHPEWDWKLVLTPIWIYLATIATHAFIYSLCTATWKFYAIAKTTFYGETVNRNNISEFIALFWHLIYRSVNITIVLSYFGVENISDNTQGLIGVKSTALFGFSMSAVFIIYTISTFKTVVKFIEQYNFVNIIEGSSDDSQQTSQPKTKDNAKSSEIQQKEEYFYKSSDTYFIPLNNTSFIPGDEKREKIRIELLSRLMKKDSVEININDGASSEEACYVCCAKPADSILINCGHGGVCYECSKIQLERNKQCMECRSTVDGIFRIEIKSIFSDVYQGYEFIKLVQAQA